MSSMEEFKAEGFAIVAELKTLGGQLWDIGQKTDELAARFGALCEGTMNAELIGHMSRLAELSMESGEVYMNYVGYANAAKHTIETL